MNHLALRACFFYLLTGVLWIWISDQFVLSLSSTIDVTHATLIQSTKGLTFIFLTSPLLYLLIKKPYQQLQASEQKLKALFEESPVPKLVYTKSSKQIIEANKAACAIYGYSREEFSQLPLQALFPKPALPLRRGNRESAPAIVKHKKKDGSLFYAQTHISTAPDKEGEACLLVTLDVHDRVVAEQKSKAAREKLIEREEFLRSLTDSQANYLTRIDSSGCYTYVNSRFCEKFGFTAEEIYGTHYKGTVIPEDWEKCEEAERLCGEKPGAIVSLEIRKKDKAGRISWTSWEFTGITNEEGEVDAIQGMGHDITSRKLAEQEAKNSKKTLDAVLDSIGEGFFSINKKGVLTKINKEFERITGIKSPDALGKPIIEAIPGLENSSFIAFVEEALKEGIHLSFEEYSSRLNIWLQVNIYPIQQGGVAGYLRNVSQKKKTELDAQQALKRYDMVAKATKDVAYDWDFETGKLNWNSGTLSSMKYQFEEVEDTLQWWEERLHPGDKVRIISDLHRAIKEGKESWSSEYRFLCGDNEYRYFQERGYILYNENQEPVRMVGIIQDIHKQKEAQKEITKLSLVAQKTQNSVIISDKEGCIEWVNEGFTRQTGYRPEEVIGKKPGSFLQGPLTDPETVQTIRKKLQHQEKFTAELINYRKNGSTYWVRIFISPIFNEEGELVQYIAIETDITERKQFIAKLERQNAQLKEIAWISSHEIRRPVASILGLLNLYDSQQPEAPFNQELIQHLRSTSKELDGVIHLIVNKTYEIEELKTSFTDENDGFHEMN